MAKKTLNPRVDNEIWKPVVGWEDRYMVSNMGNVKSINRNIINKHGRLYNHIGRYMIPQNKRGYNSVLFSKNNKGTRFTIHRLVALAFIEKIEHKPNINHINGDKKDNRVENLEWCTQKENVDHSYAILNKPKGGGHLTKKFLTTKLEQLTDDGVLIGSYDNMTEAAKSIGVSNKAIRNSIIRKHRSGGYLWRYKKI